MTPEWHLFLRKSCSSKEIKCICVKIKDFIENIKIQQLCLIFNTFACWWKDVSMIQFPRWTKAKSTKGFNVNYQGYLCIGKPQRVWIPDQNPKYFSKPDNLLIRVCHKVQTIQFCQAFENEHFCLYLNKIFNTRYYPIRNRVPKPDPKLYLKFSPIPRPWSVLKLKTPSRWALAPSH